MPAAVCARAGDPVEQPPHRMSITVNVARIGNLFYQLECLSGRLRCSQQAYRDHWARLGFDGVDDEAMLDRFAATLDVYETRALLRPRVDAGTEEVLPFGPEIVDIGPRSTESLSLLSRIQLAAYGSADRNSLHERLSLLMHPRDVAAIGSAVEYFLPRFDRWWAADQVTDSLEQFAGDLQRLVRTGTGDFIGQVRTFFGFEDSARGGPIVVHLMSLPMEQAPTTNGAVIENHAVLEVLNGESAEQRVGVMVHEIVHYLFATASDKFHRERLEGVLRSGDPRASAAFGFMNEALATALGNGVLEARLRGDDFTAYFEKEKSLYGLWVIDAAAKAIFPLVKDYIDAERPMDREFVDRYFALVVESLGPQLDTLDVRLRVSAFVASDNELDAAANGLPRLLRINSQYGSNLAAGDALADSVLFRHTYLNGFVLTTMQDRAAFEAFAPAIEEIGLPDSMDAVSCTLERDSGAVLYVVVTNGADLDSTDLVSMLEQAPPCGALVSQQ
jgi:hypothetical protein